MRMQHRMFRSLCKGWRSGQTLVQHATQRVDVGTGVDRPALDPSRLHSLAFLIRPEDTPYDVWLDEIRFVVKGP